MTVTMPVPDVRTILDVDTDDRPPQKCHTIDDRGYALCGAFRRLVDEHGQWDRSNLHTRKQCRKRGHRHCVECDELSRQLDDDGLMAA